MAYKRALENSRPAVIVLPKNIQISDVLILNEKDNKIRPYSSTANCNVDKLFIDDLLKHKNQIIFWIGAEATRAGIYDEIYSLAKNLNALVLLGPEGKSSFPETEQSFLGISGVMGESSTKLRSSFDRCSAVFMIVMRGFRLVPKVMNEILERSKIKGRDLAALITNQPNHTFLRNWREAIQIPKERHIESFESLGNLFQAGIPINLELALSSKKIDSLGDILLAGFSHAGDYSAAALLSPVK